MTNKTIVPLPVGPSLAWNGQVAAASRSSPGSHQLIKLERRLDRLEFEFRKSMHQIKTSASKSDSAADADGPNQRLGDPVASDQRRSWQQQQAQAQSSPMASSTMMTSEGSKLIDLGERLDLVEKFITITTTKMYELEQALVRLQQCECRKSCKWRPARNVSEENSRASDDKPPGTASEVVDKPAHNESEADEAEEEEDEDDDDQGDGRDYDYDSSAKLPGPRTYSKQFKEDGQKWRHELDKCSVCSCHRGRVSCKRAACPKPNCDSPQVVQGKCCPVCLNSCHFRGRRVKHGEKLVINSNGQTCKECLCLDGRFKCQGLAKRRPGGRFERQAELEAGADYLDEPFGDLIEFGDELENEGGGGENSRSRRSSLALASGKGNELEKDDGFGGLSFASAPSQAQSGLGKTRSSPLFCPPVDCDPEDQFELENDCCTYCRGYDFCSHDYLMFGDGSNQLPTGRKSSRCQPNSVCTNRNWSSLTWPKTGLRIESMFSCQCERGFKEVPGGELCVDVDECSSEHLNDCDPSTTTCVNLIGSFQCKCRPGFKRVQHETKLPYTLHEVDGDFLSHRHQATTNGNRKQRTIQQVQAGERRLLQRCRDVDECASSEQNRCHPEARCINLAGSYRCQCKRGFLGNGFECHKWFNSSPSVAAYLHRHQDDHQEKRDELSESAQNQTNWRVVGAGQLQAEAKGWIPLPPLNTLDDEHEDEELKTSPASSSQQQRPNRNSVPELSESRWESLRLSPWAQQDEPQQAINSNDTGNQSNPSTAREMFGRNESPNTRTMFLQPPPPAARPRPWWQDKDRDEVTLISANTILSDVTEKQMASSNRLEATRNGTSAMNSNQSDIGQKRAEANNSDQPTDQQKLSSTASPSLSTPKPANHKKGAIIASASTSPGTGVGRSSLSKNGRAFQQQKQFRSLAMSSSTSSSSSSVVLLPHSLGISSNIGQSIRIGMIFTLIQILTTFTQYFLPTLATAILVLISMQSNITLDYIKPTLSPSLA